MIIQRIKAKLVRIYRNCPLCRVKKSANAIRWGIIGTGYMAKTFSCAIDANKNGVVSAVASRTLDKAKRFSKRHGHCLAYGSYSDMLNDKSNKLDIIYIATPATCHYEHIMLCLSYGYNVLCEKPITTDPIQLKELTAIANEKRCFLMEGMWMKCLPTFTTAVNWISEGRIGKIELIRANLYKRQVFNPENTIFDSTKGGGVLKDFGVYAIAFITHFMGGIPSDIKKIRRFHNGIDTDWTAIVDKGEISGVINLSSDFESQSKAEVIGTNGSIEWESQFNRTNSIRLYNDRGDCVECYKTKYKYDGFEYEIDEVHKCLRNNKLESALVPLDSSMSTIIFIEKLFS